MFDLPAVDKGESLAVIMKNDVCFAGICLPDSPDKILQFFLAVAI